MAEDNLKKVWQTLYDDDYDVPDYDTFKADMEDDDNLHDLWEVVGQKYDVPEYEQFRSDMGFGAAAEAPQSTGTVVDQTIEDINRATGHMPQEVQDMAFSGQPQMNGQSLAEKNNPQMFQQPAVDPEPWKAEGLTKEEYQDIAWTRAVNAPTRQAVDEQGRIRENAAPGQGVAPEQNTGNRTYQVKESWGDELSREPSRYGELRAGWRRGARFKQLGMDGLYLSGYVGQTSPDAAAQAEGMSDAELIATHNRLSSQINKNYVGGISGFAKTPEGQQIGSQLEAIEKELHARDLGFAHASEMSGKRGEVDYRSWTSDPEVATEVNRLSQLGNRDAEVADLYLQGMSSGDMSAAKRAMLASAALYAKENNVDMDTAYAKVEGDAFNAVMRDRLAGEMDAIYNEEKASQEARQVEATKGIDPGASPADAVNFELQSRRAGNERETLNAMTRRAINESQTAKMYYNMQMRSYIRQGLDPVHAKAAAMNDLRNLFRDREVERMSPSGDWGYVGGSAFYNNMPAEFFRGLTNLATNDYEYDQILDEAYARYGEQKASTMAKVGAGVVPFVVDMSLGSFKVPGLVAKIGQQTISKGLLYGARWSMGVADDVILRRMGGNILYRTLMGGLGGGLNFMTYNGMSAAVRGFKDNNFGWNTVVEEGKRGFADGIVFGGVNGLAGKLTDVAKGAWAIPAELGVLAVEGGTFTALDYMRTGELTPESVGTSFGMAIAGRMTHFGQWASDVAARVNGTKWKNTVTGPVRLSKETRDELQDRYPEICRLMSDGELAKAMVKGARGKVTSQEALDTGVAIDKEWEAMQNDSSVPFEVRRMVNYALNGQVTPKPVTCNYRINSVGDATYGETLDINGNVIDRYKLESEKDRVNFEQGVALEAERNRIGLEQNAYVAQEYYPHLADAVEAVAAEYGMDANELLDNYYKKDIKGKAMRKAVDKVEQLYLAEIEGKTDIVSTVNDKYGVDIEEALKVPIHERSEAEHNAIEEYEQRLTGRYDEAQDKSTAELVAEDMEQSRNDGFDAQGDERADIKERLEDAANALTEMRIDPRQFDSMDENAISDWLESRGNNADEVDAVMEYLDARSAFEGIRDRVQDEAGKRIEEAAKEIDDRTNNDTGMIHPVVMGDDREAFVVAGRVVVKADGTINLKKSNRDIVVRYPDEEQPVMTTADKIKSGEPTIDPEAAKQETADGIMQEVAGEAVSQMNRDLAFNEGDTFSVLVDGKPVELTVVGTDPTTGNPILQDREGRRAPAYPDIVQQMHDEWREWVKNGGQAAVDNRERRMDNEGAPTPEAPRDNAAPVEERPAEEQAAGPAIMPTPGQGDPQEMLNYFRASGMSDRVADRTITNNIVAANERLNKAERELNESKETDPQKLIELENDVDSAQRELDYWNAVARLKNGGGEAAARQRPTEQAGAPVAENEMRPVEEPTAEIGGTAEEYQGDGMSDEMRERMDDGTGIVGIVDNIARQLGLKVRDWDGPEGIPGYIDPDNGVIYINRNRVEGTRDTYRFTLGHELTHGLKKLAEDMGRPELYEALKGAALSAVRVREGSGYDKFVSDLMNRYRSAHYMDAYDKAIAAGMGKAEAIEAGRAEADRVTQDFIEEEIVCDTVGELLSGDETRARELLEQVEDKSVMQRIKDYFTELLTKVRDAFGKGSKEYDDLDNVINRFNEMYNEVLKQREEMGTSFGYTESGVDNATDRTSDRLSVSANFEGMGFKFWDDHLDADGKKQAMEDKDGNFYVMLGDRRFDYKNHITAEDLAESDSALNFMLGDAVKTADNPDGRISPITAYRIRSNYAKLLNLFLDLGAAEKGGVPNLERNYQMVAETAFRCVSTNGDKQYGVSLDITRVCKKNEAVINTISRLQLEQGYGATPAQILDIYLSTHEEGYQVPCPVCYVFSRYIRNGKFASAAINGMEMYGQHLPGGSDPWSVERWVEELGKLGGLEDVDPDQGVKDFEDLSTVANDAINRNLTLIDNLGARLATELNKEKPNKRYIRQLEKDIKKLADEYKAACDYFGQMSQTNWIKNFAIRKVNGSWKMWEDARLPEDMEDFKAHALDLRRTAETIENYPAIQRLRKSGGSASGKEIHQASNNEMGEAIMGIGQKGAPKYRNYYKEAMETSDPVEREKLLKTAREKFDNAVDFARKQNLRGGQRMWSWSDNIERLSPDVISNLMQLEMLGAGLQSYSKQLEGVEMVARMNGYVNGSLMAKDNGYQEVSLDQCERDEGGVLRLKEDITDTVYDTWHKTDRTRITAGKGAMVHEVDGKNYVLIYDDVIGIDAHGTIPGEDGSRKLGLFDLNNQYDRAGNILVTMNDMHSKLALADDRVHFIIPWHSSGANQHILAQMFNMLGQDISVRSTDYTLMQEEKDYGAKNDGKMSVIPQHLREVWDAAKSHAEERGWSCGVGDITTTGKRVENNKAQMEYRRLRDAIMDGNVKEDPKDKDYKAIMADEFLKQVYDAVQDAGGKMTADDKKYIYPYEYWDKSSTLTTADENGWRYMEYCRRLGRRPKFSGKYGKGDSWSEEGDFTSSKGYWKTLIDRRMYDREGNFQDMTPIDSSNFDTDLVSISKMREKYTETRVADDEGEARIVQNVQQKEMDRTGSYEYPYGIGQGRAAKALSKVKLTGAEKNEMIERESGEDHVKFSLVEDQNEVKRLEEEPKMEGYRNVSLQGDGSLRSPMANRLGKKGEKSRPTQGFFLGQWEKADENPDLATDDGKINLKKPGGLGSVDNVDYNPYIHIRPTLVNKQFKNAWERDDLVYVKTQYPASEEAQVYHAEKAALPVGRHPWNGGELILSRWDKPVEIVPWERVADDWEAEFKDRGVEFDIVPPKLLPILAERGVEILPPHAGMGKRCNDAYEAWKNEHPDGPGGGKRFSIQGLDGYTEQDVLDGVRGDIEAKLEEAGVDDVTIKDMALHGSRMRGDAREDSDLDVVVEYEGDWSEDSLFGLLNKEPVYFDGIKVDINPITRGKSGTLEQYMERSRRYDEEQGGKRFSLDSVVAEAEQMTEANPTDGQKESGNYRKGHVKVDGFDISIEQPKGSVRSGVDADGNEWSQEMHNTYGYIRGTEGVDGDHIDVFLSDHLDGWNGNVYVVDQVNKDRNFDEHKVMYGFNSEQEARDAYLSNYEEGWTGLGNITGVSREEFKKWVDSSHRKNKPFAEYKNVKPLQSTGTEDRARFSISERTDEDGREVYTERRDDGTLDREVVTMPDGSRDVTWFDEAGRKKEVLSYFPNGEVRQVNNYDSEGDLTRLIQYDENRRAIRHWEPRIGTDWERDENGVARGRSNGVEMVRYSLSDEQREAQTRSENFKRWFGDWENDPDEASKVVDSDGHPKVVLHGTPNNEFYAFDPEKTGSNTDQGWLGKGFYFYGNAPEYASQYAGKNGRVLQVYLDIKNPYIASVEEFNRLAEANDPEMSRRFREQLEDEGYDGVYYNGDLNEEWVAFRPEQIKSATDNNGEFSRENPDIRFNLSEEIENYRPEQVSWERGMLDRLLQNAANNAERNDMRKQATREVNRTLRGLFDRLSAPGADAGNLGFDISRATQAAARAQRGYDRWTVDELVSMAKSMLKSGMYKELRPYEVQRLVNMINQGVGRREIQDQMNTVFDVLMKANLRGWSAQLKKLMSTKPYSINSQTGVRTIGQVDGLGGKILTAMRRGLEMTGDELTQRIAEVSDRIESDDTASHELEGLMLAQQYNDLVGKYDADNKNIKDLIREQQEKVYDFYQVPVLDEDGNPKFHHRTGEQLFETRKRLKPEFGGLDAEGNRQPVSEENKALRQRVEATVAGLENSMRENWVRMSEGYDRITDDLGGNVAAAVTRAKEFRENEKLRKQQIYHAANSDLLGVEDNTETVDPSEQMSPANWSFVRGLLGPLATFEKMMRFFGRRNANGEGRLFNMFVRRQIDCGDREWRDKNAGMDEMDNKAKELFGKKWMTMGNEMRDGNKFPFITLSYFDKTGKPRTIDLRQDEAVYLYCVNKMRDGQMKLNAMGIDGDMVEQIVQRLDKNLVKLADWYQGEFLPKHRNRYNETYERMFGTPMAHIDNYIHLNINKNETASNQEIGQPIGDQRGPTYVTGSLKERKTNVTPIELRTSIFDLAWSEHDKMEHWNAWGEFSRDLKDLINYRNFKAKVRNMKSVEFGNGKELLDNFSRCAAIVTGDYDNPGRHAKIDRAATNLAKGVTSAKIGFRAFTALKQTLSFPAFFSDARPDDLLFAMGNAEGTIKWAMENLPGFSKRWQSRQAGDTRLMETDSDWKVWKNSAVKTIGRYSMLPNASVDCLTVAIGARGVYRTAKRRYLDYGFSEAQAEKRALQDAAISYNASQQSSEGAFTSAQQVDRTLAGVATTVFRNASMGYERRFTQGLRNLKNMAKRGYREEVIENTKKQMMEEGLTEEQAERAAERVYNRMKWHSMADVVNFGFVLPFFWNLGPAMVYILGGEDDEQKQELVRDSALHALYGPIEGLSMGGTISELANIITGSMLMDEKSFKETMQGLKHRNFNPLPIISDMQSIFNSFGADNWSGVNDVFNLLVQMGVGVNPETVTNMTWGIIDACQGDMDLSKKAAFAFLRLINAPSTQVDKLYMDELGITKDEASRMSWEELAKKYARYHAVKDATVIAPFLSDEAEEAREEKYVKKFYERAQELLEKTEDDDLQRVYGQGDEAKKMVAKETAKRAGLKEDRYGEKPDSDTKPETAKAIETYQSKRSYADMAEDVLLQKAKTDAANAGDDDRADAIEKVLKSITKLRNGDPKKGVKGMGVDKDTDKKILEKIRETRSKALKELKITR